MLLKRGVSLRNTSFFVINMFVCKCKIITFAQNLKNNKDGNK